MERRRESDGHLVKLQNKTGGQKDRSDRQEADQGGKKQTERQMDRAIQDRKTEGQLYGWTENDQRTIAV